MESTFTIASYRVRPDANDLNRFAGDNARQHDLRRLSFPGGERHVMLGDTVAATTDAFWEIRADLYSPDGVMDLLLIHDALRRAVPEGSEMALYMPYVPYARQDRVANPGEALSAAVFCRLINSMQFSRVVIADPHSDVVPALLERVCILPAERFVRELQLRLGGALASRSSIALVAPDAGARKRVETMGARFSLPVVYARKHRDTLTGRLSCVAIDDDVPDLPLLVVDDICDGGGTFLLLAEALRKYTAHPLYLYVTHGLFTKGLAALKARYEGVFCAYCANPDYRDETNLTL
jgi:ribose-phosphate pyrophosphokinase